MNLMNVVETLASLDDTHTIYATEPWTADSSVIVISEPADGRVPSEAQRLGMKYFLEVFLARDFLESWVASMQHVPTLQERCARLIQYAKSDA